MDEHPGGTLDQRFEHESCDLVGSPVELFLEPRKRRVSIGPRRGRNRDALHEERPEDAMEHVDAADTDRTERVAVIGVGEPKESLLRAAAAKLPVLERLLER